MSRRVGGSLDTEVLEVDGVRRDIGVFVDASLRLLAPGLPQVSEHHWLSCHAMMHDLLPGPPS